MKKTLLALALSISVLAPFTAFATPVSWDKTANLLQPLQSSWSDEVKVPYVTATSTTGTTTLKKTNITGPGLTILGEYFTNFTTYVRSLFSNGTGITITAGQVKLNDTVVSPGSYTNANITVDQQGRLTSASSGSAGGTGTVATSSSETAGQVAAWGTTSGTPAKLYSVATSSLTVGTGLTTSATLGNLISGSNAAISFASIAANSLWVNNTGASAVPTAVATSTLKIAISDTTGTLLVARGGTGQATFTSSQLLYGNGTNALSSVGTSSIANGTNITVTNGSTAFVVGAQPTINLSGVIAYSLGGTGTTTAPQGQLLYGGATAYQSVATSAPALPAYMSYTGTLGAFVGGTAGTFAINALPVANGGTASTTALGGILVGNGSSAIKSLVIGSNLSFDGTTLSASASGGGSFPFSADTNYGQTVYSTSTPTLWFKSGLFASSTSYLAGEVIDDSLAGDANTTMGATNHEWNIAAKISDFSLRISSSTAAGTNDVLVLDKSGNVYIGTSTDSVNTTQKGKLTIDGTAGTSENLIDGFGNVNDFIEYNITNHSAGTNAESGFSATRNDGTLTSGFNYVGINSTGFTRTGTAFTGGKGDATYLGLGNNTYFAQGTVGGSTYFLNGGTASSSVALTLNSLGGNNRLGIGSTTPFSLLAVHAIASSTLTSLFSIGSSTAAGVQTTLFNVSNTGAATITGSLTVTGATTLATSLTGVLLGSSGVVSNASVQTCTNQFVRAMSASYVATCATVGAADVSLANLTATDSTLTFSGTYTGATARTIGVNLANPNTWTGLQQFSNASSTQFSAASQTFYVDSTGHITAKNTVSGYSGVLSPSRYLSLGLATTTTPTSGTTTGVYVPTRVAPFAGTVRSVVCIASTTAAFMGVTPFIGNTPMTPAYFIASSTGGTITFTAANTFTKGQLIGMLVGSSTASNANQSIDCEFETTETP